MDCRYECRYCDKTFTKKSNLKRHMLRQHDNKSIHHHGLQYVDKRYISRETMCFLHKGIINDGKMFHCFTCNFSICSDCMEEDCIYCNRNICTHKNILIIINQNCRKCKKNSYTHNILIIINHKIVFYAIGTSFKSII